MTRSTRLVTLWGPPLLVMAVIFAFSQNPASSSHHRLVVLLLRKAGHLSEYALLMALLWRAFDATIGGHGTRALAIAYATTIAYAATDEFHQTFIRGRVGTWHDVLIDGAGALIAAIVIQRLVLARRSRERTATPA